MVPNICKSPTEPWFWGALKLVAYPAYPKISQDIPSTLAASMKSPFWRSPWWHVYHIYSKPPWTSWPVDFSTFLVNAMRDKPIIWCPRIPSQNLQKMQRGLLWPHPIVTLMRKFIGLHPHFNGWLNPFWPHMKETPDVKKTCDAKTISDSFTHHVWIPTNMLNHSSWTSSYVFYWQNQPKKL